jgi:hypothetical protein
MEVVNFTVSCTLYKRQFKLLLKEVDSVDVGLLRYDGVQWLIHGLKVECLN